MLSILITNSYCFLLAYYFMVHKYLKNCLNDYTMSMSRKSVLQSFKLLHRTRMKVFEGDSKALTAARTKINEEYKKNKLVTEDEAIRTMIKFAEDVEKELRTQVIQAREIKPGVFEAKITEDTLKLENIPYNESAFPDTSSPEIRPCCKDQAVDK